MDRATRESWAKIAIFAIPVLLIGGCRVGLRACVRMDHRAPASDVSEAGPR